MKKLFALLVMAAMLLTSVAALADSTSVAVIYSDTVDDKGWCQAMDTGIKALIEEGLEIEYTPVESVEIPNAQNVMDQLVGEYDIIVVHGAQFTTACTEVAAENPEQIFVLGTTDQLLGDNIFSYMPQSEEPGYVNGVIAALMTKTGKVGIVGSTDGGDSARFVRGFIMGLQATNPEIEYMCTWTNSFSDTVGAGDNARTLIEAGCDVLTGCSQQAVGAIRVAETAGVTWIGQTLSQMTDFPAVVVAAADYDYSAVLRSVIENLGNGVTGNICIPMNYNNAGFVYDFSEGIDAEIRTAAEAALAALTAQADTLAAYRDVNP